MAMNHRRSCRVLTGGVDTHSEIHVAAALDPVGGVLGTEVVPRHTPGLLGHSSRGSRASGKSGGWAWKAPAPTGRGWPGSCARAGSSVVEVDRPNRQARRRQGKSDPLDAVEAARAALSGSGPGRPRSQTAPSRPSGC